MLPSVVFTHLNVSASTDSRRTPRERRTLWLQPASVTKGKQESVADDLGGGGELSPGEVDSNETLDDLQHDPLRLHPVMLDLDRGDERRLAARPAPGLSRLFRSLPAEVGIIELHPLGQADRAVALLHHLHQLVLELPGAVQVAASRDLSLFVMCRLLKKFVE